MEEVLKASVCSRTINTSFVERRHATDRAQNARKSRRTYRFSKDWRVHEAMTYFTAYRYNFCWPVRTLRIRNEEGAWQPRTPAMAAGLADHVWSLEEWLTFPAFQSTYIGLLMRGVQIRLNRPHTNPTRQRGECRRTLADASG